MSCETCCTGKASDMGPSSSCELSGGYVLKWTVTSNCITVKSVFGTFVVDEQFYLQITIINGLETFLLSGNWGEIEMIPPPKKVDRLFEQLKQCSLCS